ncbi:MAG: 3-deoxy-7-phosphoheptulonate synthase class II [Gammaproteobacteria bacterium]|nr:3-deoxy-7-phosphoheptulonate synthase class II [Gammaproteobacteria bacterium]
MPWQLESWQKKSIEQQVDYPSLSERDRVINKLQKLPPLVIPLEIEQLKSQIAKAARGEAFLLQGGDCAESFADCNTDVILNKIRILLQISLVLLHGLHKPVIRVGRIAGQYAKPRSSDFETINGVTLPTYRGDLINDAAFEEQARRPDPNRMLEGYEYSAMTLNFIRSLVSGGFANLFHPEYWNLRFKKESGMEHEYHLIVDQVHDAMEFIKAIDGVSETMKRMDFYISHEALHLHYEQALTRQDDSGKWYNVGTHYPWVGMRTASLESAHIEYIRGIANPVAIKVGPSMTPSLITQLVERLNPNNEPGKLTLIHRFGSTHIAEKLPPLIEAVQSLGAEVLWTCDPMHGNTTQTTEGYKTRQFDIILSELEQAIAIHQAQNSYLGGVHFELTGDEVTECIGGARGLTEANLKEAYRTLVDPRLNYEQSLEMAMCLVGAAKNPLS